ncbi:helix-turn-helix transcriptional regulator, partial [Hoeflea sp.]|uniref:helix-turn-helix transcriptional regulator n=1 Tax=Hoeflea sp. TaxID=1940281 RepID=UPI003A8E64D0
ANLQAARSPSEVRQAVPWKSSSSLLLSRSMDQSAVTQKTGHSRSKRLFAVIIRDVSNIRVQGMKLFAERFHLTRSENDLCSLLSQGFSIREVANTLGLAEDTIRKRTKSVFQKTDTHRQGQLIGLINKYL